MELKYLVILTVFGVATGVALPNPENNSEQGDRSLSSELASSFPASYTDDTKSPLNPILLTSQEDSSRDKRHLDLLFKKFEKKGKGKGGSYGTHYGGNYGGNYGRQDYDVHHHHHYSSYPYERQVEHRYIPRPFPSQDYHHYHGGYYPGQDVTYNSGGYSNYHSGPSHYPQHHAHYPSSYYPPPPSQHEHSSAAAPATDSGNNVDRGQGSAAVNNIAIIHARAGSTSSTQNDFKFVPDTSQLSKSLGINLDDYITKDSSK